ncbi:MAG TPA: carboxypeptidase-like regulatory domain-containing protein [Candidatus Angelobacter sp.]|jgi:hypothetical protein
MKVHIYSMLRFFVVMTFAGHLLAQNSTGNLRGQVSDPSGAVVPGAVVSASSPSSQPSSVQTDSVGNYVFTGLAPGDYTISVNAKGFAVSTAKVRVSAGQDLHSNFALKIATKHEQVVVEEGADRPSPVDTNAEKNASALVIAGKALDALSDDPDQLEAEILAMSGPAVGPNGGRLYIDGFTGARLPPKASIREIRINQNPFAPDKDKLGYGRVEVTSKGGTSQYHGQVRFAANDSIFNSMNPFLTSAPSYQSNMSSVSVSGPAGKKMSFFVSTERRNINENSVVGALTLDSNLNPLSVNQAVPNPKTLTIINPRVDYQISSSNNLTARYQFSSTSEENGGIAELDLASEAMNLHSTIHEFLVTDAHVFSASTEDENGFDFKRMSSSQTVLSFAPEIQVQGSFNGGGNAAGNSLSTANYYEIFNNLSISHGTHGLKFGGRVRIAQNSSFSTENFDGVFAFDSLKALQITERGLQQGLTPTQIREAGGGASQFLISDGNPLISSNLFDLGVYAQDDWRIRSNVNILYGLRFETQNAIHDHADFAPRLGFAWAPGGGKQGSPKTVIRGGFGLFYDRFTPTFVLTANRLNGITQREFVVNQPDFYPNIPPSSVLENLQTLPTIYRIGAQLTSPYTIQTGIGVEQQLWKNGTVSVVYLNSRGIHQFLSRNVNAPLPGTYNPDDPSSGVRPLGDIGNIFEFRSDGFFKQNQLIANYNLRFGPKLTLFGYYTLGYANSTTAGTLNFPSNQYDVKADYGRAVFDIRHRFSMGGSLLLPYAVRLSPFILATSGHPFNITTGEDLNGDSIFNDRPAFATDLSRPSVVFTRFGAFDTNPMPGQTIIPARLGEGTPYFTLNMRVSKVFALGARRRPARSSGEASGNNSERYSLTLAAAARNLLNNVNFTHFVGQLTSPLFGQPTALAGQPFSSPGSNRQITVMAQFAF